jgi:hypothetical protein
LVAGIVLVIIFALPKPDDNKAANTDKKPNTDKAAKIDVKAKPSGGYSFKLAHKASTSFEVTFKKDHLIEVHSFAPVLISVYLNSVDRSAFVAFKNTEKRTVIVRNNSIGAAEGVLEIRQTPRNRWPSRRKRTKSHPRGDSPFLWTFRCMGLSFR